MRTRAEMLHIIMLSTSTVCCPLENTVENIDRAQVWACPSITLSPPQKSAPFRVGSGPHVTHGSLGQQGVHTPNSISIGPAARLSLGAIYLPSCKIV